MKRLLAAILVVILSSISAYQPARAQSACNPNPIIALVSISLDGIPVAGFTAEQQSISDDGRYVIFESFSDTLIPNDPGSTNDIFVYDRETCQPQRISENSAGERWDENTQWVKPRAAISGNGHYVVFASTANNLVPDDTSFGEDLFIRDIQAKQTIRIVSGAGDPSISITGRFVAFSSVSSFLPNGSNNFTGIFVYDRDADHDGIFDEDDAVETTRVSVSSEGTEANWLSEHPFISGNGRYVVFDSQASNLVDGDTNTCSIAPRVGHCTDVFLHDRYTRKTTRISVSKSGVEGNNYSYEPMLSANGRFAIFYSEASNLVNNDHNMTWDFFIYERQSQELKRLTKTNDTSTISGNGRFVAFASSLPNLVRDDTNICLYMEPTPGTCPDIFVQDLFNGKVGRVSIAADGTQTDAYTMVGAISGDGQWIAFVSSAGTLVPGVEGNEQRVYIAHNPLIPLGTPLRNNFETSTPSLTWNRLSWVTGYHVQIARDPNFNDIVFEDDDLPISSLEVTVNPPLGEGRYYWRVRGLTNTSAGKWSATDSFTINIP